jgi:hypothetical protein
MSWMDIAADCGYSGDEQRQYAAMIEQEEYERFLAIDEDREDYAENVDIMDAFSCADEPF